MFFDKRKGIDIQFKSDIFQIQWGYSCLNTSDKLDHSRCTFWGHFLSNPFEMFSSSGAHYYVEQQTANFSGAENHFFLLLCVLINTNRMLSTGRVNPPKCMHGSFSYSVRTLLVLMHLTIWQSWPRRINFINYTHNGPLMTLSNLKSLMSCFVESIWNIQDSCSLLLWKIYPIFISENLIFAEYLRILLCTPCETSTGNLKRYQAQGFSWISCVS